MRFPEYLRIVHMQRTAVVLLKQRGLNQWLLEPVNAPGRARPTNA